MSQQHLEREGYLLNPQSISQKAIDVTLKLLRDKSDNDLRKYWQGEDYEGFGSSDIFSERFQMMRIGVMGWNIQITDEQRQRYGIQAESVDYMGKTSKEDENSPHGYYLYFGSIGIVRALVGGAFIEQARIDGLPLSAMDINDELIDACPFKTEHLGDVYANMEGAFMINSDELEAQWQKENELLYRETMGIIRALVHENTPGSKDILRVSLPEGLVEELEPEIRDRWQSQLHDTALRTYAIFTPNAPKLIPVPVREGN